MMNFSSFVDFGFARPRYSLVITNSLLADFDPPCGLDFRCRWRCMPSPSIVVPVGLALSWWLRQCVWTPSNAPDLVNGCDNKLNMSHAAQQLVKLCAPYLLLHWWWLWWCVCSMFFSNHFVHLYTPYRVFLHWFFHVRNGEMDQWLCVEWIFKMSSYTKKWL